MKCASCPREAYPGESVCCPRCPASHTADCDVDTFPKNSSAQYYHDPDAGAKLLDRMRRAIALSEILEKEVREVSNIMRGLGLTPQGTLDSLAAHLSIDLQYIGAELKRTLK
jgi:hypothetical protein